MRSRPFRVVVLLLVAIGLYGIVHLFNNLGPQQPEWSSTYSGWYTRSRPIKDPVEIHLNESAFHLIATTSAWGHTSFVAAIFEPGYCVTETGVVQLTPYDAGYFMELNTRLQDVSKEYAHYNRCPGLHDVSTRHIDLSFANRTEVYEAYAYSKSMGRLTGPCKGANVIPQPIDELLGLLHRDELGKHISEGPEWDRLKKEIDVIVKQRIAKQKERWRERLQGKLQDRMIEEKNTHLEALWQLLMN